MRKSFRQYYELREDTENTEKARLFLEDAASSELPTEAIIEHVAIPAILQGSYEKPADLLNEMGGLLNKLKGMMGMGKKEPEELKDLGKYDPEELEDVPDDRGFRPVAQRQVPRFQATQNVLAQNKEKDARNMMRQRTVANVQHGQKLKQIRDEILDTVNQCKDKGAKGIKMANQMVGSLVTSPHGVDVLNQFTQYMMKALSEFKPQIDLRKWQGSGPDYSGIKSGLKDRPNHEPHYGGQYGDERRVGRYPTNQFQGDRERDQRAAQAADFNKKNRNIRAN